MNWSISSRRIDVFHAKLQLDWLVVKCFSYKMQGNVMKIRRSLNAQTYFLCVPNQFWKLKSMFNSFITVKYAMECIRLLKHNKFKSGSDDFCCLQNKQFKLKTTYNEYFGGKSRRLLYYYLMMKKILPLPYVS